MRTIQDIQNEYNSKALQLGAEVYKVHALSIEIEDTEIKIEQLKKGLLHLNKEAGRLQAKQADLDAEAVADVKDEPVALPKGEPVELPAELGGPASSVGGSSEQS